MMMLQEQAAAAARESSSKRTLRKRKPPKITTESQWETESEEEELSSGAAAAKPHSSSSITPRKKGRNAKNTEPPIQSPERFKELLQSAREAFKLSPAKDSTATKGDNEVESLEAASTPPQASAAAAAPQATKTPKVKEKKPQKYQPISPKAQIPPPGYKLVKESDLKDLEDEIHRLKDFKERESKLLKNKNEALHGEVLKMRQELIALKSQDPSLNINEKIKLLEENLQSINQVLTQQAHDISRLHAPIFFTVNSEKYDQKIADLERRQAELSKRLTGVSKKVDKKPSQLNRPLYPMPASYNAPVQSPYRQLTPAIAQVSPFTASQQAGPAEQYPQTDAIVEPLLPQGIIVTAPIAPPLPPIHTRQALPPIVEEHAPQEPAPQAGEAISISPPPAVLAQSALPSSQSSGPTNKRSNGQPFISIKKLGCFTRNAWIILQVSSSDSH